MPNKKISELPSAAALDGSELVEGVQGGTNVKMTSQAIADLGGGGGSSDLADFTTLTDAATIQFDCDSKKEPKGYVETANSRTMNFTNVRADSVLNRYTLITLIVKKTTASDIVITLDSDFTNKDLMTDASVSSYTLSGANNAYFKLYALVLGQASSAIMWWSLSAQSSAGIGVQDFPIMAAAMWPKSTNGCAELATSTIATSELTIKTLDFDQTTQEFCAFQMSLPRNWNNGTVTVKFYWTANGSPTGDVEWGIAGGAYSDNDALTTALGTAQVITDTFLGNDKVHITDYTPAVTLSGTPADADFLFFRISRNPASGGDTMNADAKLLGIVITLTTDASTAA